MTSWGMTSWGMTNWGMKSFELDPKILPAARIGFRFEFHLPVPVLSTCEGRRISPHLGLPFLVPPILKP